jgi:hypothetical protein
MVKSGFILKVEVTGADGSDVGYEIKTSQG